MGEAYTMFIVTEKDHSVLAPATTLFQSPRLEDAEAFFDTCVPNEKTFFLLEEMFVKTDRQILRST